MIYNYIISLYLHIGFPRSDAVAQTLARNYGMVRVSAIWKVPGFRYTPHNFAICWMHVLYLGEAGHLMEEVCSFFSAPITNKFPTYLRADADSYFYCVLSDMFYQFGNRNHMSFGKFKTLGQWRGLKAHGIKDFVEVGVLRYFEFKLLQICSLHHR
jgi:hypothetical protein